MADAKEDTYQPKNLLANEVPQAAQVQTSAQILPTAQTQASTYQPQNLLAGEDVGELQRATAAPVQDIPEGLIPQLHQLGGAGYMRELEGLPEGIAGEISRVATNLGASKYSLMGAMSAGFKGQPQARQQLAYTTELGKKGKTLADIAAITAASETAAATGGSAIAPEAGVVMKALAKPAARILGTTGFTTAAANPGEKFAGAINGLVMSLGGEMFSAGLKAAPETIGKVISWFKKSDESPLLLTPDKVSEATARAKEAQEVGVTGLTAGALTRDPTIQAREEMISKATEGDAAKLMHMSNDEITNQVNASAQKIIKAAGGNAKTEMAVGEDVQNTLRGTDLTARKKISNIYNDAAEAPGGNVLLPSANIVKKFDDVNDDFVDVKFAPRVKKIIGNLKAQQEGAVLYGTPEGQLTKTPFTVKEANKLTQALNKSYRSATTPADKMAISAMTHEVYNTIDDVFEGQVNPAASLFKLARTARKNLGDVMSQKDIVENIVRKKADFTNYYDPETISKKIFSSSNPYANMQKVKNALKFDIDKEGNKILNPKGEQAWNNLRQSKLNQMLVDSTNSVNGKPVLSYAKLVRNYKKIGKSAMDELFDDKELSAKFDKLINVMDYWQNKAPGVINYSNSANMIVRAANKLGLGKLSRLPFVGSVINAMRDAVEHAKDKEWVMKNLRVARTLTKDPKLATMLKPQVTNPQLADSFMHHLIRSAAASVPMIGQQ